MISLAPHVRSAPAPDLDRRAEALALFDPAAIERLVAAEVAAAIRERRTDDAVTWHRIRLRALRLRTAGGATSACRE